MKTAFTNRRILRLLLLLALGVGGRAQRSQAAGLTILTHGLEGNADGWINAMALKIPAYGTFPGTNISIYKLSVTASSGTYYVGATRTTGGAPTACDSGEIIVRLDWSTLADGNSANTYDVARAMVPALLATNFISELGGHALAELPIHFVGHSRGGSLACEVSRELGTNGVWLDHLTTLDPHPLNNDGFNDFLYTAVDAPARTWANVLFHDNYWQHLDLLVYGEAVAGAYVRKLTSLTGGYSGLGGAHSDVHLWYHGTLDAATPTSDGSATIASTNRTAWWNSAESSGALAGFHYSLIAGGDRLNTNSPAGSGQPAIRDGFNQSYELGAGMNDNRTALPSNTGEWPNLIRLNRTTTNAVAQGQDTPLKFYWQWACATTNTATVSVFLDDDQNPFNTNQCLLGQFLAPATGDAAVSFTTVNVTLAATNAPLGRHTLFAAITGGDRTRYLYAPEVIDVLPSTQPPMLDIAQAEAGEILVGISGVAGQTFVLQTSTNLLDWPPLATNTLTASRWVHTNGPPVDAAARFYRALLKL